MRFYQLLPRLLELKGSQVTIEHVSKKFGDYTALDNINITIQPGEFFSLLGPSGCGKTTLLRIIAGFEFPDDGVVLFATLQRARTSYRFLLIKGTRIPYSRHMRFFLI